MIRDRAWQGKPERVWENVLCRFKPAAGTGLRIEFYRAKETRCRACYHPPGKERGGATAMIAYGRFYVKASHCEPQEVDLGEFMEGADSSRLVRAAKARIRRLNDALTQLNLPPDAFAMIEGDRPGDEAKVRFACRIRIDTHDTPPVGKSRLSGDDLVDMGEYSDTE